jgi:hypothetical protein
VRAYTYADGGIRTHEAEARDLETRPFDRSGTSAVSSVFSFSSPSTRFAPPLSRTESYD